MDAEARRGKRNVLLVCAATIPLFSFADTLALRGFSPGLFAIRIAWAAGIVVAALLVTRVDARAERVLMLATGVGSSLAFALLAQLTGGAASPLFHWILAMPVVIAV